MRRRKNTDQPPGDEAGQPHDVQAIFDTTAKKAGRPGAISVVTDLLFTVGALVMGFVLWALFLSDIGANAAAQQRLDSFATDLTVVESADYTKHTGEPPAEPADLEEGETLGIMYVPALGDDYQVPIAEGSSQDVLNEAAAGRYTTTQLPGEVGNFAVSGHRTTYGKIFHDIEELEVGDPIVVRTDSAWYVYTVSETRIVAPSQNEVLAPVPGQRGEEATERALTITTCHPLYGYSERYIVHATLDHWVDPAEGTPKEVSV